MPVARRKLGVVEILGITATGLGIFATLYGLFQAEKNAQERQKLSEKIEAIRLKVGA